MDLDSYIECAIWSSNCWERTDKSDNPTPFDAVEDCEGISDAARDKMLSELADFQEQADKIIESKDWEEMGIDIPCDSQIAHDFWLTRNGHGVGFWDRGTGELGDKLTELAESYGEQYLWLNEETMEIEVE